MHPLDDQLVGYLLDALDDSTRRDVEVWLRCSAQAREKLRCLREMLEPLDSDRVLPAPPSGLAESTVARVVEAIPLPRSPRVRAEPGRAPSFWSRSDLLAASLAGIICLALGAAWLGGTRRQAELRACQDNLRRFHGALVQYAALRPDGAFPRVEGEGPRSFAGIYVPALREAGAIGAETVPVCPTHGKWAPPPDLADARPLEQLHAQDRERFDRVVAGLSGCYAYSLGYRDEKGLCGLRHGAGMDEQPIMGDAPPFHGKSDGGQGNSLAHGGRGQNVLCIGGHVRFVTARSLGDDDDIYLNQNRRIHAGVNPIDTVLGAGDASP